MASLMGLSGQVQTPTVGGTSALVPVRSWYDGMSRLFGKNALPDESIVTEAVGRRSLRGWDELDQKYQNRFLFSLTNLMTAAMLNQRAMDIVLLGTQVCLSYERQWKEIFSEVIQSTWTIVAPTGVPRTVNWKIWSSQGRTQRFKATINITNKLLSDPNFGMDNLLHQMRAIMETGIHTILLQVTTQLASRPLQSELEYAERRQEPYTYADNYRRTTRHFGLGAKDPAQVLSLIAEERKRESPEKDTVIFAEGDEWALKNLMGDKRAFPYKVRDYTDEDYMVADQLSTLQSEPQTMLSIGDGQDLLALKCPAFRTIQEERYVDRYQPLRRRTILARAYEFAALAYGPTSPLDGNAFAVPVLHVTSSSSAEWVLIHFAEAVMRSHCGFIFDDNDVDGNGKPKYNGYLDSNPHTQERVANYKNDAQLMNEMSPATKDGTPDMPSPNIRASVNEALSTLPEASPGMAAFRQLPWFMRFVQRGPGNAAHQGGPWRMRVNTIGQMHEKYLPTQHLVNIVQTLRTTAGMGADQTEKCRRFAAIMGRPLDWAMQLDKALKNLTFTLDGANNTQRNHANHWERQLNAIRYILAKDRLDTAQLPAGAGRFRDDAGGRLNQAGARHFRAQLNDAQAAIAQANRALAAAPAFQAGAAATGESEAHKLLTRLPNAAIATLEPHVAVLGRMEAAPESREQARLLVDVMAQRIAAYGDDAGHLEVVARKMADGLQRIGVAAGAPGVPTLGADAVAVFKRVSNAKAAELSASSRVVPRDAADWSRGAQLAAAQQQRSFSSFGAAPLHAARFEARADQVAAQHAVDPAYGAALHPQLETAMNRLNVELRSKLVNAALVAAVGNVGARIAEFAGDLTTNEAGVAGALDNATGIRRPAASLGAVSATITNIITEERNDPMNRDDPTSAATILDADRALINRVLTDAAKASVVAGVRFAVSTGGVNRGPTRLNLIVDGLAVDDDAIDAQLEATGRDVIGPDGAVVAHAPADMNKAIDFIRALAAVKTTLAGFVARLQGIETRAVRGYDAMQPGRTLVYADDNVRRAAIAAAATAAETTVMRARAVAEARDLLDNLGPNVAGAGVLPLIHADDRDALADHQNGDESESHWHYDRAAAIIQSFSSLSYDELYMVVGLMSLPPTPKVLARLAENGVQIIGGRLERWNERYESHAMLLMKRGGEACQTILSPMEAYASSRGVVGVTDFTFQFDLGVRWVNSAPIVELNSIFPRRIEGGLDASMVPSAAALREMVDNPNAEAPMASLVLVTYPVTESRHEYSCNWLGGEEVWDRDMRRVAPSFAFRKCSGHVALRAIVGEDVCGAALSQLRQFAMFLITEDIAPINICPIVERGLTYQYDSFTRSWCRMQSGTGPLAPDYFNVAATVADIFNGKGRVGTSEVPQVITVVRSYH